MLQHFSFSHCRYKTFMLFIQQKMFPFFVVSRSSSLSLFFSSSFAGLSPAFSFSIFQICGHDNKSKLNTLDNTDTETISAFRFRLCWLFSCLCFTRRGWLCDFLPKEPRVAFGLPYLLIELFYFGVPVVRTDGRAVEITVMWLPKYLGWVDYHIFIGMGLRSLARGAPLMKTNNPMMFPIFLRC